jgi:hypothetical protein
MSSSSYDFTLYAFVILIPPYSATFPSSITKLIPTQLKFTGLNSTSNDPPLFSLEELFLMSF